MKNLMALGLGVGIVFFCLAFSVGCGSQGTPTSKATPPMAPEDHMKQMEEMMKSGKVDPKTYGIK